MYKVFHTLVPRGGMNMTSADTTRFNSDWDRFAVALADLASRSDGFRFYTRTPRTEAIAQPSYPGDIRYLYEAADIVAFDTAENATAFRAAARRLDANFLDAASSWLIAQENIAVNGAPKGPLDTGRGVRVITSMRRRPGMQVSEFRKHWDDHAQYVIATQGISRYIANYIVDSEYEETQPPVDGFVEAWFRTLDDLQVCFTDPLMTGPQQQHNGVFIDTRTFFTIQCRNREQWVRGTRAQGMRSGDMEPDGG